MGKIKYITYFFLLQVIIGNAQKQDIRVIYEIVPLVKVTEIKGDEAKNIVQNSIDILETFEFELLANKNEAVFKKIQQLKSDDVPEYFYNIALTYCDGEKIWYTNVKEGLKIALLEDYGESIMLNLDEKTNWELTGNIKKSEEYTLVEAKGFRMIASRKEDITAWFSKEIPYNFGPNGYGNLPGLIIELETPNVLFHLKSVEKIKAKIKKPTGKKTMSFTAYYEKLENDMKAIMARGY